MTVELDRSSFGATANGSPVEIFTFTHTNGLRLAVINYGCIIQSLHAPDKDGILADIVLGYDTLAEYETDQRFLGCVVGRYANRIAHGKFTLEGVDYQLETNPKGHHIHGGSEGFNRQVWQASTGLKNGLPVLRLQHHSPHGQGGYPGNLNCEVSYAVTASGEIEVSYNVTTDQPTVLNLTNHSYFNLAGHDQAAENAVLNHQLRLECDEFLPTDASGIPLSDPVAVDGTPMDFRSARSFAERINNDDEQLINGNGYDHNWVVNRKNSQLCTAAIVIDPESGRSLEVATTQPGIQVYTSNYIDGLRGKGGVIYQRRGALCLETQHYPDSPNRMSFPSTLYTPDRPLNEISVFKPGYVEG